MNNITKIITAGIFATQLNAATVTDGWENSANFGLTLTRGNSETILLTTAFNFLNDNGTTQQLANLSYTFGESDSNTTADVLSTYYTWNKLVSETTYYGFRAEGLRDDLAGIEYRLQATALYGIHLLKNDTTTFSVEFGPGYTVESVGDDNFDSSHIYLGQRASHKLSETSFITQSLAAYAPLEDLDNFNVIFNIAIESKVSENMNLRVALENTYTNNPADGADENDLKLISGISYKF